MHMRYVSLHDFVIVAVWFILLHFMIYHVLFICSTNKYCLTLDGKYGLGNELLIYCFNRKGARSNFGKLNVSRLIQQIRKFIVEPKLEQI